MKTFAQIAITNVVISALGAASGLFIAFALGSEGRGELAEIMAWPQLLAGLLLLSINEVVTVRVASNPQQSVVKTVLKLLGILIPAMLVIGYATLVLIGKIRLDMSIDNAIFYFLLYLPFNFVGVTLLGILNGTNRFAVHSALRTLHPVAYIVGVSALWMIESRNAFDYAIAEIVATFLVALACVFATLRNTDIQSRDSESVRNWLRQSLKFHQASAISLLYLHSHRLLIILLASRETIGEYVVAYSLVYSLMWAWSSAAGIIALSRVAGIRRNSDQETYIQRTLLKTFLGLIPVVIAVWFGSDWFFQFVLGDDFQNSGRISSLLAVALIPQMLLHVISRAAKARNRIGPSMHSELVGLLVFCASFALLWGQMDVYAAVLAIGISGFAALCSYFLITRKSQ